MISRLGTHVLLTLAPSVLKLLGLGVGELSAAVNENIDIEAFMPWQLLWSRCTFLPIHLSGVS